ncbi:MAG: hypothetical protein FJZ61_04125 [Chlamydiae bacterium]|nr:hypothetical protein [Chlamydiota bacterium]
MFSIRNLGTSLPTAVSQFVARNPGKIALVAGIAIGIVAFAKTAKQLYQINEPKEHEGKILKKVGDKIVWVWPKPNRSIRAEKSFKPLEKIKEGPNDCLVSSFPRKYP